MPYLILILAIVFIILIWWIATSNKFRKVQVKIDEASSGIDIALTKRYDTLTKLLDITKAYAKHEVDTFEKIVTLRQGMSLPDKNDANEKLDNLQSKISVLAENYPELKSSENYRELQVATTNVEEHLQAARRLYNANVSLLNQMVVSFPQSIVSNAKHITKQDFFSADETKKADVAMSF